VHDHPHHRRRHPRRQALAALRRAPRGGRAPRTARVPGGARTVKRRLAFASALCLLGWTAAARADPPLPGAPAPDQTLGLPRPHVHASGGWALPRFLPSPELAFGRQRSLDDAGHVDRGVSTAFGLRWQLTPVLWSFGVHRRQSRWRFFVVDPFARQSGSLEL